MSSFRSPGPKLLLKEVRLQPVAQDAMFRQLLKISKEEIP